MTSTSIVGKWRFAGMSSWDLAFIALVEPGFISFAEHEAGELVFSAVTASLYCAFDKAKRHVTFRFEGSDEGDEVSGDGWAELSAAAGIAGEFEFRNGDGTTFEARRW